MALFCEVVEIKVEYYLHTLTWIIKYTVGKTEELVKHCIQLPHDKGYKYVKSLLKKKLWKPLKYFLEDLQLFSNVRDHIR